jgi:hypothetical protein
LLEEEASKRAELERWHLEQQQAIQMTEAEKQELEQQRVMKEQALQEAMAQLAQLELERKQALEQYEVAGLVPTHYCARLVQALLSRAGNMAWWQNACLVCVRPWVPSPAVQKNKPNQTVFSDTLA